MGCNYYFFPGTYHKETCRECGHTHKCKDKVHIGKSSIGRYFTLHGTEVNGVRLNSLESWMNYIKSFEKGVIKDEYGKKITVEQMKDLITRDKYKEEPGWESKLGTPANKYGDISGKKGLVYSNYEASTIGQDGLYVVMYADFS